MTSAPMTAHKISFSVSAIVARLPLGRDQRRAEQVLITNTEPSLLPNEFRKVARHWQLGAGTILVE